MTFIDISVCGWVWCPGASIGMSANKWMEFIVRFDVTKSRGIQLKKFRIL